MIYSMRARFNSAYMFFFLRQTLSVFSFEVCWHLFDVVRFLFERGFFSGEGKSCVLMVLSNESI